MYVLFVFSFSFFLAVAFDNFFLIAEMWVLREGCYDVIETTIWSQEIRVWTPFFTIY